MLNWIHFLYRDVLCILEHYMDIWCAWQSPRVSILKFKFNASSFRTYNKCGKESNINPNYNENSIAICLMFTHLKTITVLCERQRYIMYTPLDMVCVCVSATIHTHPLNWFFTSILTIHQNRWNEINCAHKTIYTLNMWAHTLWFHLAIQLCLRVWNAPPDILSAKPFDSSSICGNII